MKDKQHIEIGDMQRAKARYEGMRRDPSIKNLFPDIDTSQPFEEWFKINYKIYWEKGFDRLFYEIFINPELFIFVPFILDDDLKVDDQGLIIDGRYKNLSLGMAANSMRIEIDFDKVNNIKNTIKEIENEIEMAYEKYHMKKINEKSYIYKIRNTIDIDITYKIGDIVQKLRKNDPKISWRIIAQECINSRLFSKDIDIDSAEKTVKNHYWPRYQDIVFKGGWRSL